MAERNLNFDAVVNRKNTDCLKYDFAKRRGMPEAVPYTHLTLPTNSLV